MTTYRELVYSILNDLKLISDDSFIQQEQVIFLLDKYRGFILKKYYSDIKKEIPESNYQTICLNLEKIDSYNGDGCKGLGYLRSIEEVPNLMTVGNTTVSTSDFFNGTINYVNRNRFKYAGESKYSQNAIYSTIAPDDHLYIKSGNPQAYYLNKVKVTGIFEDSAKAAELSCDLGEEGQSCDTMDTNFPLEEALIPLITEAVLKELSGVKFQAEDKANNASDDLSNLATYIRNEIAKGRYSDLYKNHA